MADTYEAKNSDYGNSFEELFELYECQLGEGKGILAILPRILDKAGRITNLALSEDGPRVKGESILDTLLDLAAYCVMSYSVLSGEGETREYFDPKSGRRLLDAMSDEEVSEEANRLCREVDLFDAGFDMCGGDCCSRGCLRLLREAEDILKARENA